LVLLRSILGTTKATAAIAAAVPQPRAVAAGCLTAETLAAGAAGLTVAKVAVTEAEDPVVATAARVVLVGVVAAAATAAG